MDTWHLEDFEAKQRHIDAMPIEVLLARLHLIPTDVIRRVVRWDSKAMDAIADPAFLADLNEKAAKRRQLEDNATKEAFLTRASANIVALHDRLRVTLRTTTSVRDSDNESVDSEESGVSYTRKETFTFQVYIDGKSVIRTHYVFEHPFSDNGHFADYISISQPVTEECPTRDEWTDAIRKCCESRARASVPKKRKRDE